VCSADDDDDDDGDGLVVSRFRKDCSNTTRSLFLFIPFELTVDVSLAFLHSIQTTALPAANVHHPVFHVLFYLKSVSASEI